MPTPDAWHAHADEARRRELTPKDPAVRACRKLLDMGAEITFTPAGASKPAWSVSKDRGFVENTEDPDARAE